MALMMLVVLMLLGLVVLAMTRGASRDLDLAVRRVDTVRAFYAAEAGMNMAVRELMEGADEDGDGGIGSISDDGNPANDPSFGRATFSVTSTAVGGGTSLVSVGRSGDARREIEATIEN